MQNNPDRKEENGSILFYILIAVALFAALSYSVSQMMRGGADLGSQNQAILVDDVLDYARNLKETIQTLRIMNECQDDEISFERSPFDGSDAPYINASAPSDFSCHVFHPQGGGIGNANPIEDVSGSNYVFTGVFGVTDIGSDSNSELSIILRGLDSGACGQINDKIGLAAPLTDEMPNTNFVTTTFQGSYSLNGGVGDNIGTGNAMYNSRPVGCFYEDSATSGEYIFYQVLIPR
ncbi:MAG: hypothetical protein ACRBDI_06865 [Alphaproteobacteria bacterium]